MNRELIFTLKEYKNRYNELLTNYLLEYEDFESIDFLNNEIIRYNGFLWDIRFEEHSYECQEYWVLGDGVSHPDKRIVEKVTDFLGEIDTKIIQLLNLSFNKIVDFLEKEKDNLSNANVFTLTNTQQTETIETTEANSLNWQGSELQFTELTKALFETKLISPEITQKEFFKRMKQFFNVKDFDDKEKLKGIRARTKDLTPFINTIETSLNNWIKNKD